MNKFLIKQTEEERKARKTIMEVAYLILFVFLLLIMILAGTSSLTSTAEQVSFITQGLIATAALISFIFSRRGYTLVGAYFLPWGILLMTFVLIYNTGVGSINALFFVTIIAIAGVIAGIRGVVLFACLSIVSVIGLSYAQTHGFLAIKSPVSIMTSAIIIAHVLGNAFILIFLVRIFNNNLHSALEANQELRQLQVSLEQRIAERTRDLAIASEVSRQITRVLDMDVLLPELVEKTHKGFNLYYVSLYLYDHQAQALTLEADTGRESELIKSEAKSILINSRPSVVAKVARECKAEIINDTAHSDIYLANPHLPDTRAEAAFPMLVGDELVGVLDLQSEAVGRFQESEAQIFSTLAEQIAIAVRNAKLYHQQEHLAQELERADLMKSQFLASMSHELRTPLNAIINFTQLIAMGVAGPVTDEQAIMLNTSLSSSRHLLQLINDVLDISKIQAGKLSLYVEEDVNLNDEVQTVVDIAEALLQKQNVSLEQPILFILDIDKDLPLTACDRRRIRQVLLNLLSNAIKFTEQGSITLSVKKKGEKFIFAVMDTGPGIPQVMQAHIFEPFGQTTNDIKHSPGTGLGLPISRSLVQAHGGELWMESDIGEGTTFFFSLPFRPSMKQ
jgi:signal transduction histidine kinase